MLHSETIRRTPHAHVARSDPGLACICYRRISVLHLNPFCDDHHQRIVSKVSTIRPREPMHTAT